MRPLTVPPAAQRDENAVQMLSAWIAERGLHCSLNIGMWHAQGRAEVPAWGVLLADVIRHVSNAIQEQRGTPHADVVLEIMDSLHAELDEPTSAVHGRFHPGHS